MGGVGGVLPFVASVLLSGIMMDESEVLGVVEELQSRLADATSAGVNYQVRLFLGWLGL